MLHFPLRTTWFSLQKPELHKKIHDPLCSCQNDLTCSELEQLPNAQY